jgi:hypothetical protein
MEKKIYGFFLQKLQCHMSDLDWSEPLRGSILTDFRKKTDL